ncbi:hypothetical protein MRX96_005226 [Rhipicephalus microplus]
MVLARACFRFEAWRSSRGQGECVTLKATVAPRAPDIATGTSLSVTWGGLEVDVEIKSNVARPSRRCSNSAGGSSSRRRRTRRMHAFLRGSSSKRRGWMESVADLPVSQLQSEAKPM